MIKIVFINVHEYTYLGTRCLASYLQENGFYTHNIMVHGFNMLSVENPSEDFSTSLHRIFLNGVPCEYLSMHTPIDAEDYKNLEIRLKEIKPDIIGYSSRSPYNYLVPQIQPVLKKACPEALLVAGGYGPTLNPEVYLDNGFDVVSRGDGEDTWLALAKCAEKGDRKGMLTIPGTIWSVKYDNIANLMTDQVKDLSRYPAPLSGHEYFSYISGGKLHRNVDPELNALEYHTFFGRGCTGKCAYCSGGQWSELYRSQGKKAYKRRNRDVSDVMRELEGLPDNIKFITFTDEYWALTSQTTRDFFTQYKKKIKKPFWAYLDYQAMINHPDLFDLVLDAGLAMTGIGFQSGSYEFAKKYYARTQDYAMLLKYAELLFKNKIYFSPQFIEGNCYATWGDFYESVKVVQKLPFSLEMPYFVNLTISKLCAHPKSPLREKFPRVVTEPCTSKEWFYQSTLLELSRLLPFSEIQVLIEDGKYSKKPVILHKIYQDLILRLQYRYFKNLIKNGKNWDWVFYGAGSAYEQNKRFFSSLNPKYILIDRQFHKGEDAIDGIPVITAEDFFEDTDASAVQVMSFIKDAYVSEKKLLREYKVPFENIHSCPSNRFSRFSADVIDQLAPDNLLEEKVRPDLL